MHKKVVSPSAWVFIVFLAVACLLSPAATLPVMACGGGACAGSCESACNCGMSKQAPEMQLAMAPAMPVMASFDPSLMTQVSTVSVPDAPKAQKEPAVQPDTGPPSDKTKIYDLDSSYRI